MEHDTEPVVRWLIAGAPSAQQSEDILAQLCERLVACALPLWRAAVFVRTLHPHIAGRRFLWRQSGEVEVAGARYGLMEAEEYRNSPIAKVAASGIALRRRLAAPDCALDFEVLHEFRAEGVTDYLVSPLIFTNGEVHVASWTTRRPGGFSDRHVAGLEAIVEPLARIAEIYALRRTGRNFLDTYVGAHAGQRVLAGRIRRGDSEAIHAAIWLSDMRGFTALADRLQARLLIDLLNRYFEAQVPAIAAHGGEVLKFMGDGLLAIFPVSGDDDRARACTAALAAARAARANIATLGSVGADGIDNVRFGLALHVGEVLYGNIGSETRLDFTCIGPAVNLAARIEKIAGELGRTILASGDFAAHCPAELAPVGEFAVRGFGAMQRVFGLPEES